MQKNSNTNFEKKLRINREQTGQKIDTQAGEKRVKQIQEKIVKEDDRQTHDLAHLNFGRYYLQCAARGEN